MIATSRRSGGKTQAYQAGLSPVTVRPDSWVLIPSLLLLAFGISDIEANKRSFRT